MKEQPIKYATFCFATILFAISSLFAQPDAEKQGKEIYEKYQAAIGSNANGSKIKNVETIKEQDSQQQGKSITKEIKDYINKRSYTGVIYENGQMFETGFDGTNGWSRRNGEPVGNSRAANAGSESASNFRKLPNQKIDGKEYLVVEESSGRSKLKTFYDPDTFLLFRTENQAALTIGSFTAAMQVTFSDYRKVGDVMIPFTEKRYVNVMGNGNITTVKVLSVRHNIKIDPSIFKVDGIPPPIDKPSEQQPSKEEMLAEFRKNTIYQDEYGKEITEQEFDQKLENSNYAKEPITTVNGKAVMRLKQNAVNVLADDFTGTLLDGSTFQLSQAKGKVVVLNFWSTACAPCIKEMPELNELVKQFQSQKDVEFYSITYNTKDEVAEFFTKHKFDYQPIVNAENILETFKNPAYPTHIVIDREGKILLSQLGYSPKIKEKLIEKIETALKLAS